MKKIKKRNKNFVFPFILVLLLLGMFFGVGYSLLHEELTIKGSGTINGSGGGISGLPEGKDFDVTFHENGGWGDRYNYAISLKNLTTTASTGWIIYILVPSDTKIVSNSGCNAEIKDGMLILTNASHNGNVGGSGSASWVAYFTVTTTDSSILPFKYTALKI